uniref:Flagellasialin n=3 Tax=Strongylocentrotidae TaxID=31181 RepID=A0SHR5_STRPU|nr:semaphorin-6D-like precursor [Strongylocentrotus purpuratus]ABD37619.1 flagellasialin [Hemicentrotus pulcherrimus]ABD37620.1 flagellasialin [Strongylocentrotus purpuratus]ABD37621.1 flagellasialin [Mesocentrotus franciscanus]
MKSSSSPACLTLRLLVACCVMWTINAQTGDTPTVTVTVDEDMTTNVAAEEEGTDEPTDVPTVVNETEVTEEPESGGSINVVSATLLTVAVLTTTLV